ncbi:transcriptional regulator [Photobacterium profundum]|uniref:Transcription activator ToxR n=1 Tax=Photobacterium profundum 3TCK TaxID=314280 RepID=Q1Z5R8_9GAMM|nr:transcriptional regulator [Photobacterium profundum]EAS43814.1 transcription activator ToxR [Photobacterium profundum 3TCK]PSV64482.1 transcriptional regulator [Photobacterium profundum]
MLKISTKYLIGQRFLFDPYDNSLIDQHESDELTRLGSNESRALGLLIEDPGAIITRNRLHDYVWREQGFEVDDSSLTQAISTLRKALKDSTKSPDFIKTVPKRGYQMIAPVEEYSSEASNTEHTVAETPDSPDSADENNHHQDGVRHSATAIAHVSHSSGKATVTTAAVPAQKNMVLGWGALVLACLLPLLVNLSFPPKSEAFAPLLTVDGITVSTTKIHPVLSDWKPMISECVTTYLESHQDKIRPVDIIVTGGQNNSIWLNYIHDTSVPNENVTLRLLTSQEDNSKLCQ